MIVRIPSDQKVNDALIRIEDTNVKIKRCTRCRLSETRIHALCGEGNLLATLMLAKPKFWKLYGNVVETDNKQILPLQHPAAVLHDASIKAVLVRNYQKIRLLLLQDSEIRI